MVGMMFSDRVIYRIVLFLCAIFFILSALIFAYQIYSFIEKTSNPLPSTSQGSVHPSPNDEILRGLSRDSPPFLIYSFFGMVVSSSSLAILIRMPKFGVVADSVRGDADFESKVKRIDSVKPNLMPEARQIIDILEQNGGKLPQSELVKRSNIDKLKVSRIIKKLESMDLVKKHPYGMTNLVVLIRD